MYADTLRPGLQLRVGTRKKAWMFEKRVKGGARRKHGLGEFPQVSLAKARAAALEIELESLQGVDRIHEAATWKAIRKAEKDAQRGVGAILESYAELKLSDLATGASVERELWRALGPFLGAKLATLTKADLQAIIDAHVGSGHVVYANRMRAYLRTFTKWLAQRNHIPDDIGGSLQGAGREMARDRVLSLAEIRQIYAATMDMGTLWRPFLRLLLLTGQRRGEIIGLRWSNVNFDQNCLELTGNQRKNRRPHITHLSEPAMQQLEQRQATRDSELVFTTTGVTPSSGVSRAKRDLDKALGAEFEPWRLHDFRRAMATHLAAVEVPEGVVDRIQNHAATGSAPSAVARVYQQANLLPQRAEPLEKWAAMVIEGAEADADT